MGELHFSRLPESEWEDAILRMKSAGVDIISTYIIWIHHEEVQGEWDWSGRRDLRRFALLCRKHGMLLYPRIGPWAHGEVRNGGLPDWVVTGGPIRQQDPKFMAETGSLYNQIGAQLRGLLWKDGGPVVGIQIENEYSARGPGQGEPYLLALKRMAVASGLDVPLYTLTGWDKAVVPAREFLPVYGGYPDAPWGSSRTELPPQDVYAFRFRNRVTGNMGAIGAAGAVAQARPGSEPAAPKPFLTAEMGGGMQDTYHRRLIVSADDITAMMPVMLGSGVNLYGSYMFTGGQNPQGKLTTLQESQATHYPTDVPEKSYDFQAPIGEYGLERRSLRLLKNWNYFLNDFGGELAPMPPFRPEVVPAGPTDLSVPRWSVRTDGRAGFLFLNNYARGAAMPARPHVQFAVALPGGKSLQLPEKPIAIPPGVYFAWPFGLDLGGVPLRYGTAQLVTRLSGENDTSFVFACIANVRCELALEGESLAVQTSGALGVERRDGATMIRRRESAPGFGQALDAASATIRTSTGKLVRLLLLSPEQAEDAWRVPFAGETRLLNTGADVFADTAGITLRQLGNASFRFGFYPEPAVTPKASVPVQKAGPGLLLAELPKARRTVAVIPVSPAGMVPPVSLGPALVWRPTGVAQAPSSAVWAADAARWSLTVNPAPAPLAPTASGVSGVFLHIPYTGDAARFSGEGRLLDDDFFNGEPWVVGLDRYAIQGVLPPLTLEVLLMRGDAPVYLPTAGRARIAPDGQTIKLGVLTLVPQYQLHLTAGARAFLPQL